MATESAAPVIASDDYSGPTKTTDDNKFSEEEATEEISPKSVFVNSQPIREDQVRNAVSFLSHPKVRGSPVIHRRNFLERKGLTKEEIDEAFRRVPDPSPALASAQATNSNQGGQLNASANIQQQSPLRALQPVTTASYGVVSTLRRRFHWSHAFIAVGFLVTAGAGTVIVFRNTIFPRLRSWIRKVAFDQEGDTASKPSVAEEAVVAAKAAAAAAADVAKASQEMLITKNEERKHFQEFMNMLNVQLQEIKWMRSAILKLEAQTHNAEKRLQVEEEYLGGSLSCSKQITETGAGFNSRSARTSPPINSAEPPHPKSFMEIMDMVQRGEKPSNIREINDLPPNPYQPISNPSISPRPKPWEVSQPGDSSSFAPRPQLINAFSSSMFQTNSVSYQQNNDSVPWWQQQQKNVTITEFESEGSFRPPSNGRAAIHPLQRKWIPPQAPPFTLPEAAVAIRQPKSSAVRDSLLDNVTSPMTGTEERDKIIKISESGGQKLNGGGSGTVYVSEIHTEVETEDSHVAPSNNKAAVDPPPLQKWVPTQHLPELLQEATAATQQPNKSSTPEDLINDHITLPVTGIEELD